MHSIKRKIKKEWVIFVSFNEANSLSSQIIGQVPGIIDNLFISIYRIMGSVLFIIQIKIVVPPMPQKSVKFIKSTVVWMIFRRQTQMPFSKYTRPVPRFFEQVCKCNFINRHTGA